jgi:hypothetical protein
LGCCDLRKLWSCNGLALHERTEVFDDKASQHRGAQLSACFGREAGGIATSQRSHSWPLSCVLQNKPNTAASRTTLHSARPSAQHRLIVSLNDPRHFQINDSYLNPQGLQHQLITQLKAKKKEKKLETPASSSATIKVCAFAGRFRHFFASPRIVAGLLKRLRYC